MFDTLHTTYKKIISCIGVIGYLEEDIKKRGANTNKNLPLNCLYAYPSKELSGLNPFTYQMMFPDNNHQIPCPKFFALTLTNQQATHSYLYCLKFSEKYSLATEGESNVEIDIPIVIFIKSEKEDLESFKQLLNIINFIIVNDDLEKEGYLNFDNINDFKKVQLMNLFYFLFALPHTSPHSQVKLKVNKEITNSSIDSIDFYFSSNCEIPCNKNDTDINILFLILDQSIIIKVLFAILTEKRLVIRASQAYLLHLIIPTFLKLIFPFKWLHSCITVLPKENLDLLEAPGSFIFGVLSDLISLKDLMREYPGIIVVDCDTNEIFGDSYLEPFEPSKQAPTILQTDEKDRKFKKFISNINVGNNILQGNNLLTVNGSYLYKYELDSNLKKTKLNFQEKNNIIIDTEKSQLLIDKTNIFIDSMEWKWLRRNIQLVRNPEIFDLENINNKKNNSANVDLNEDDEENIILPDRSFSYNIQNILMRYILNKLSYTESEFMSIFKKTNLFLTYNEPTKYQNNSGKRIIENILDLKKQQRNFDNCFNIEYTLQNFKAQTIINIIDEIINENNNNNEKEVDNYSKIKSILNNYIKIGNEEDMENLTSNNYDGFCESERHDRKVSIGFKDYSEDRKSELKKPFGRLTKTFIKGHERNKTSVLQETISMTNNFLLSGVDNSTKGIFKFYKENGFLQFVEIFENFTKKENINIKEELYEQRINEQILNIILNSEDFFSKGSESKSNAPQKGQMAIIPENPTEEEDDIIDGRMTVIQRDNIKVGGELHLNLEAITENRFNEEIINFPNLNEIFPERKGEDNENSTKNIEQVNHKAQFYLFIALIIEDILKDKEKSEDLMKEINDSKNVNMNIKSLLLKLYRLAYKYSGAKHRDFPYFSYYNFLLSLGLDELKLLQEDFNDLDSSTELELFEIYGNVIIEHEKKRQRKDKDKHKKDKNLNEAKEEKKEEKKEENKKKSKLQDLFNKLEDKILFDKTKDKDSQESKPQDNNSTTNTHKRKSVSDINEFNIFITYIINMTPEFECKDKNVGINLVKNIAQEILEIISIKKNINNKNIPNALEEVNKHLNENKKIFSLIGQLKYINVGKIELFKERMSFWLNCFNFLMIFTFFYKKWIIHNEKDWKYFFKNVKYNIGGTNYSFHDMQYILYKKVLFFPSSYIINDSIKKFRVNKAEDAKIIEKKYPLLYNPFMIYVPIKNFIKPVIYEENQLENQYNQRIKEYLSAFITIDNNKNLIMPELLLNYNPNFIYKELKKFQPYIETSVYNFIKEKKYKSYINKNFEWKLDFDRLFENTNQDT